MPNPSRKTVVYGRFLLFIAGMGGLLYGIDVGIVTAALLYVDKTLDLTVQQTGIIVAAVFGGGTVSSLIAGALADWLGRKTLMILSGLMFVGSVAIIVLAQGFVTLLGGRLVQGVSVGIIAVVVPLYLAECLSSKRRGSGTAMFQFMLTLGIVVAAATGFFYTEHAEAAIVAAHGDLALVRAAQDHAWRSIFLSVVYPGLIFFIGSFFLSESPRWLARRGKLDAARAALLRTTSPEQADIELKEMMAVSTITVTKTASGSLLRRKYVIPFLLACVILSLNQTTGINSVISYLVLILKQAGMTASHATQGDVVVKVLNCLMTVAGIALVDRKGRKFLLCLGTGGIVAATLIGGILFHSVESQKRDVISVVQSSVMGNTLRIPVNENTLGPAISGRPMSLTVLYSTGSGSKVATALSNDADPTLVIPADPGSKGPLIIKRAQYGPVPTESTGWIITACLALFIASYASGPGVIVWLMLTELMPTRIRAMGMGIALLLNQGISMTIAGVFLSVVGNYGYYAMFFFWAGCTVLYFLTAAFFVPETKGKSLEEIEVYFEKGAA